MLQVDRIKIVIKTSNGNYGFNETFNRGLNFIASEKNTSGKVQFCLQFTMDLAWKR